jgi:endoglucanase
MDFSLLQQLVETPGVSGREERVREVMTRQFSALKAQCHTDAMGSLIGHIPGQGPRVALIAHMDEVGFLVSKIEPQGFVRVMPVGGIDPRVFGAQKVMVHGRQDLPGMVGSVPPHLLKKGDGKENKEALPIEESFIDLGLPAEEVAALVKVGDPVTFATAGWQNEHTFFSKAIDDRVGLFVMVQAVQQAKRIGCDLFLIASTQEEYGLRGAGPAIYASQAQIALALEGTVASDTPGLKLPPNILSTAQGKGPEIRLTDRGMIAHRALADFLVSVAENAKIPHQVIVKNTGSTDAAAGQTVGPGVKAGALSVPVRYIHAPVALARKADIVSTINVVAAFLEHASEMA